MQAFNQNRTNSDLFRLPGTKNRFSNEDENEFMRACRDPTKGRLGRESAPPASGPFGRMLEHVLDFTNVVIDRVKSLFPLFGHHHSTKVPGYCSHETFLHSTNLENVTDHSSEPSISAITNGSTNDNVNTARSRCSKDDIEQSSSKPEINITEKTSSTTSQKNAIEIQHPGYLNSSWIERYEMRNVRYSQIYKPLQRISELPSPVSEKSRDFGCRKDKYPNIITPEISKSNLLPDLPKHFDIESHINFVNEDVDFPIDDDDYVGADVDRILCKIPADFERKFNFVTSQMSQNQICSDIVAASHATSQYQSLGGEKIRPQNFSKLSAMTETYVDSLLHSLKAKMEAMDAAYGTLTEMPKNPSLEVNSVLYSDFSVPEQNVKRDKDFTENKSKYNFPDKSQILRSKEEPTLETIKEIKSTIFDVATQVSTAFTSEKLGKKRWWKSCFCSNRRTTKNTLKIIQSESQDFTNKQEKKRVNIICVCFQRNETKASCTDLSKFRDSKKSIFSSDTESPGSSRMKTNCVKLEEPKSFSDKEVLTDNLDCASELESIVSKVHVQENSVQTLGFDFEDKPSSIHMQLPEELINITEITQTDSNNKLSHVYENKETQVIDEVIEDIVPIKSSRNSINIAQENSLQLSPVQCHNCKKPNFPQRSIATNKYINSIASERTVKEFNRDIKGTLSESSGLNYHKFEKPVAHQKSVLTSSAPNQNPSLAHPRVYNTIIQRQENLLSTCLPYISHKLQTFKDESKCPEMSKEYHIERGSKQTLYLHSVIKDKKTDEKKPMKLCGRVSVIRRSMTSDESTYEEKIIPEEHIRHKNDELPKRKRSSLDANSKEDVRSQLKVFTPVMETNIPQLNRKKSDRSRGHRKARKDDKSKLKIEEGEQQMKIQELNKVINFPKIQQNFENCITSDQRPASISFKLQFLE